MTHTSDERTRIAEIKRRLASRSPEVAIGIGDDAAVLAASSRRQVLSVDASVEGVHFRRGLIADHDIGYRATAAALSDLAAMGATPRAVLSALVLPATLDDETLYAIVDGIGAAARACGAAVVGGNLSRGGEISITTTVAGDAGEPPLARTGAHVGDGIWVTGSLGAAAFAWRALERGADVPPSVLTRFRRPTPRITEGQQLLGVATAAIDLSDGLVGDLGNLCEVSGVGADLYADAVPVDPALHTAATAIVLTPLTLALTGGEDYELLFTLPAATPCPIAATRIGTIVPTRMVRVLDAQDRPVALPAATGHDHFRGA